MTTAFILILFFFNFYAHIHKYFRLLSTRVVCATFQTRFYSRRGSVGSLPFRFLFPFGNSTSAGWVHDLIASNPLPSPLKFPAAAASLIELPFRINDKETRWRGASTQIYTHTHKHYTLFFTNSVDNYTGIFMYHVTTRTRTYEIICISKSSTSAESWIYVTHNVI